jgi:hypothetical protein
MSVSRERDSRTIRWKALSLIEQTKIFKEASLSKLSFTLTLELNPELKCIRLNESKDLTRWLTLPILKALTP